MSIQQVQNGPVTGQTSKDFTQAEMFDSSDFSKPFYLKITPGTDIHTKITEVADDLGVTQTKAGRVLILGGWMGWRKFTEREAKLEATDEG